MLSGAQTRKNLNMASSRKSKKHAPEVCKTIFQVRYKPDLKFYDRYMSTAQRLDEYPDWSTNRLKIVLRNYEKHCSLNIEHNAFSYEQDSGDSDLENVNIQRALEEIPSGLQIETSYRLGYRRRYLISVDMSFESLVSILNIKLYSQNARLREIMPQPVDLMYEIDAVEGFYRYHIMIGPVQKPEIPQLIAYNVENHLHPASRSEAYNRILMDYPDVAVFADIDFYQVNEEGIRITEATPFVETAKQRIHELIKDLADYMFSEEVEV